MPPKGTPEHSTACANLIRSVQDIYTWYPEGVDAWDRESFLLQASLYAHEFDCGPIGLPPALEPDRE